MLEYLGKKKKEKKREQQRHLELLSKEIKNMSTPNKTEMQFLFLKLSSEFLHIF